MANKFLKILLGPSTIIFLLICLAIKLLLTISVFQSGFYAFGGDDFGKLATATAFSEHPNLTPNKTWLPLQFVILAIINSLFANIYTTSLIVNFTWSSVTFVVLYFLAKQLFDEKVSRISTLLLICFPWHLWLGISGQGEAMFLCIFIAIAYYLIRWQSTGNHKNVLYAALLVFVACSLRYQGWVLALIVASYLLSTFFIPRVKKAPLWVFILATTMMFLFPIFWLGYHYVQYNDPFYWGGDGAYGASWRLNQRIPVWIGALKYSAYLGLIGPLLFPFIVMGIYHLRSIPFSLRFPYALLSYGYLFTISLISALQNMMSYYVEQRYVLPIFFTLIPLMVFGIKKLRFAPSFKGIIVLVIFIYSIFSCFRVSRQYMQDALIAKKLTELWSDLNLSPDMGVFIHKQINEDEFFPNDLRAINLWSQGPKNIQGHSGKFCKDFETAVVESQDSTMRFLLENKISVILTDTPGDVARLNETWQFGGSLLGYKIFYDPRKIQANWNTPSEIEPQFKLNYQWKNGIELTGWTFFPADFPRMVIPLWTLNHAPPGQYKVIWEFVLVSDPNQSFTIESGLGNGVSLDRVTKGKITDRVLIGSNANRKKEGTFKFYLSLVDSRGMPIPLLGEKSNSLIKCDLGEVKIIFTKTRLIFNFLTGKQKDYELAIQGIFSILN